MQRERRSILFILLLVLFVVNVAMSQITYMQEKRLRASDRDDADSFGWRVSISGDYAIVGAYLNSLSGDREGSAYIFYRNQGGTDNWGQVKRLVASDRATDDSFGYSVAIDGNIAIVGANNNSLSGTQEGTAYIFYRNRGGIDNWGQVCRLKAKDRADEDHFGQSVSIDGTYAVVGAYGKDLGGTNKGAAYIFEKNTGGLHNWGQIKRLRASDRASEDYFGWSVDVHGDYVIVGAYRNTITGDMEGSAYIFYRHKGGTDNWGQAKRILASDRDDFDGFGVSVSIHGDHALVGAPYNWITGDSEGSAYIYRRDKGGTDNWGQVKRLLATDRYSEDLFGMSVCLGGDFAAVGAPWNRVTYVDQGSGYVFYRYKNGVDKWGQVKRLLASDGAGSDQLGRGIGIDGPYVIAGAPYNDLSGTNEGTAYIYKRLP